MEEKSTLLIAGNELISKKVWQTPAIENISHNDIQGGAVVGTEGLATPSAVS